MLNPIKLERLGEPLLPVSDFILRMLHTIVLASIGLGFFLGIGILGYHYLQGLEWLDALLNASMILSGMGPVDAPKVAAAKWFASFYALLSGVVFISTAGVIIAPIAHRLLHLFHAEDDDDDDGDDDKKNEKSTQA